MALAAGGGADALGMLGGSDAVTGSDPLGGGGTLEQQLREQQQRVRDLEIILADERSEAQSVSGAWRLRESTFKSSLTKNQEAAKSCTFAFSVIYILVDGYSW